LEASDDPVPFRLKLWLASAFALADGVARLAAATVAAKRRALERRLNATLAAPTTCDLADAALPSKLRRARDQLLTFVDWPGQVAATNNACERHLRPAVVQRKATNGHRAMWAAGGGAVKDPMRVGGGRSFG
jgi:transposase